MNAIKIYTDISVHVNVVVYVYVTYTLTRIHATGYKKNKFNHSIQYTQRGAVPLG